MEEALYYFLCFTYFDHRTTMVECRVRIKHTSIYLQVSDDYRKRRPSLAYDCHSSISKENAKI